MWPALIPLIGELLKVVIPNPKEAADAKQKLAQMMQDGELAYLNADMQVLLAQLAVNATEATSPSLFKSGWRPAVGWVCVAAFAWNYLLSPMMASLLTIFGHPVTPSLLDMSEMMPILMGLLGLGGMRTFEKLKGKT